MLSAGSSVGQAWCGCLVVSERAARPAQLAASQDCDVRSALDSMRHLKTNYKVDRTPYMHPLGTHAGPTSVVLGGALPSSPLQFSSHPNEVATPPPPARVQLQQRMKQGELVFRRL